MWTLLLSRGADPRSYIDQRQIDGGQIKIGRALDKCDWVIPDNDGYVSREHCTILVSGLDLYVLDTSTYGTTLNGAVDRLPPHQPTPIRVHDKLQLGDFIIEVAPEGGAAGAMIAAPPPSAIGGTAQADDWFQPASDPIWNADPQNAEVHEFLGASFNDFLAPPPPASPSRSTGEAFGAVGLGAAFSKPIMAPMTPSAGDFGIPEDWASIGSASAPPPLDTGTQWDVTPMPSAPPMRDPFGDLAAAPMPVKDPFGGPAPSDDPFAAFAPPGAAADPFAASPPSAGGDPFADFFAEPIAPLPNAGAPIPPPATPVPPAATKPTAAAASGGEADWAAFCEGAGIDLADLRRSPDGMRRLGVLYRQVVLGLSDLIQDRAAFKSEFRMGVTSLAIGRNNPLKMLDPLDTAKLMLADPMPGFMPADEAIRSAFEDIKRHQMAMLAGVQHALTAVFKRLAPAEIERLMEKAAGEKRGLPFKRGVDPWTVYQTVFDALRVDATSNANSVMSVAFRDGYEAFLKRETPKP